MKSVLTSDKTVYVIPKSRLEKKEELLEEQAGESFRLRMEYESLPASVWNDETALTKHGYRICFVKVL